MARYCWVVLSFFPCALVLAEPLEVQVVRVWAAPDNTRVVFDINQPAEHNVISLDNPPRLVLDLHAAKPFLPAARVVPDDRYLRGLRSAVRNDNDLRVVLDLKQSVRFKVFQLQPNQHYGHRLVVDLLERSLVLSSAALPQPDEQARDVIVAIDAGHGGDDPGAVGGNGTLEKDVALGIARKMAKYINARPGLKAVQIRTGDYFMALRDRMERARALEADLFISVHADAFRDHRVQGSSVYVLSERGASSEAAKWRAERENASDLIGGVSLRDKSPSLQSTLLDLSQTASLESSINVAKRVLEGLAEVGTTHRSKVQSAGFLVLKSPDIPSILVETGFITNPEEEKKLTSTTYQDRLVHAIVDSLDRYFSEFAPPGTLYAQFVSRRHVVRRGDTLSEIAKRYSVSTEQLRRHNNMRGDILQIGRVLSIPQRG